MVDPFEARERSFYITGEMTAFDVAAVQDYLGKLGLRVMEKPLPAPPLTPEWVMELPEVPRSEIFTAEEFKDSPSGMALGQTWTRMLQATREGRLPLELRRSAEGELGVSYQSAEDLMVLLESEGYDGYPSTWHARKRMVELVESWRQSQEPTAS